MHLTFRLSDVDQLLWIISESEIFAIHFVIRLGIAADRAVFWGAFGVIQISAVGTDPDDFFFLAEDLIFLYVRQQQSEPAVVIVLDHGHAFKQFCDLGSEAIDLTTAEFDLLWLLARHAGSILSRDDLLQELRGIGFDGLDRSIDARISRLRRKLGDDPENPSRIKTVRGKGYLFSKHDWQ